MTRSTRSTLLSPQKRALVEAMLREEGLKSARREGAGRRKPIAVSRDSGLQLSYAQERLWFLDQMILDSAVYNIPAAIRLAGRLDAAALEQSLLEIVRRHESLRTGFKSVEGMPVVFIDPAATLALQSIDLRSAPENQREEMAHVLAGEEARQPLDLACPPLLRAKLLRLDETEHVLLLTTHHIISDGWSMGVLFRELSRLYETLSGRESCNLPDLPIQYGDYAFWQRNWLQGAVLEGQLSYWEKQLAGRPSSFEWPTDRPRPSVQSYRGAKQTIVIGGAVSKVLRRVFAEQGVTLFMTLLAAFKILLHRYTGETDLLVGTPVANRSLVELEPLIGFFANTLVLRTNLAGDPTFAELVKQVREVTIAAFDHQDVPFERLVEELHVERSVSRTPLVQALFALNDDPMQALQLSDLAVSAIPVDTRTAKFDVTLSMSEAAEGLTATLEYNTDLFDAATIDRMLRHFGNVLQEVVKDPQRRISEISLLAEAERRQLLAEWNDTAVDYAMDKFIPDLFEAQASRCPDVIAVVFEDQCLTYAELTIRANQWARFLQRIGVGQETLVGIAVERSLEMVIGVLGILKAGGAYVPIDPEYPRERRDFMLEDAGVPVLLTQERLGILGADNTAVVCLDGDCGVVAGESGADILAKSNPDGAAYMIYTSGSTGRPKGAVNTQRGICNRLLWMQDTYGLTESDRVLQKTPLSFDVSVWELFWPLIAGARLIVASPGGHRDSSYLVDLIREQEITVLHFVPSMMQLFLEERGVSECASLRHVICSGEALSFESQQQFFALCNASLHNLYGPTEAAVDVTAWACNRHRERRTVPIGRPISNIQIYLLDRYGNPSPIGVPGELHIGGAGLARGYHNRPELTADKFAPDPFSNEPGSRLYHTGDLARILTDGTIEFLGRIDKQVKIRGFRIELGEIETLLREFPGVRESAAIAREDARGEQRLIAYLVADHRRGIDTAALCQDLKKQLPDYMVPSAFVVLDDMPLTPSGKLDRRALPVPKNNGGEFRSNYVAPENALEHSVCAIWRELLCVEQVGMNDNFFDLGGNSLLMVRLRSRLRAIANRELTMVEMFRHPTVTELVGYLSDSHDQVTSFEQSTQRASNRLNALRRQRLSRQKSEQL